MSVVGFDLGNESCVVAVARQRAIDVVLNDESKRETPAVVTFGDKQRFVGTSGAACSTMNPTNSVSQIKRLIGRRFSDPVLQRDLDSLPFAVSEGPDGLPLIHANYLGERRSFTPTQLLAMLLSNLKSVAENALAAPIADCCIGIPVYFTDLQRRAVLDAAAIAGLRPLRLLHETTATALGYGIYKTDLPSTDPINVAFVDVGHASMQVCVAAFKKGQLKILSHAYDRSLGGRDFDEVLFRHFALKFKEEYKIDVYQNARACIRLRVACEKLKKMLSANPEAPLNVECLMDEKDVRGFMKREEFEIISRHILERIKGPLERALVDAGLDVGGIHSVEVVGSGSRIPSIIRILTEFFGKEPRRTMNASECVARGCALQCAVLSPIFKVREFQVHESFPFSIALSWSSSSPESENGTMDDEQSAVVFPKGNPIPSIKSLSLHRYRTFSIDAHYSDESDLHGAAKISTYTIGPFQLTKGNRTKLNVNVHLNLHGIVSVDSASIVEEEQSAGLVTPKDLPKESTRMGTIETHNYSSLYDNDGYMQDDNSIKKGFVSEVTNGILETEDKPVQMEIDPEEDYSSKKIVKLADVTVTELVDGGMTAADFQKAMEKELEMALQDRVMEETKDKKNAVEAYVYDMRNKLHDQYQEFVKVSEREEFSSKLQEVEDWLYEDGMDETKGVYVAKLEELKKLGDPIEVLYKESVERQPAIYQLFYSISSFREAALSKDSKFDHIDISEKQKVINMCGETESWLRETAQQQDALPKHATPILILADLKRKAEELDRFCRGIMTKPKPATAKTKTLPPAEASNTQAGTLEKQAQAGRREEFFDSCDHEPKEMEMSNDDKDFAEHNYPRF